MGVADEHHVAAASSVPAIRTAAGHMRLAPKADHAVAAAAAFDMHLRSVEQHAAKLEPASLDQEVGLGLGAQAGEQRLGEVAKEAGFSRFRRATETPFNLVLEARP